MITEGNTGTWTDKKRKLQQFKRTSGKNKGKRSRNTYSNQAIEAAENMRNRGETG